MSDSLHRPPDPVQLEVCAGSVTSGIAAELGGACRIELCANLAEGGTTPSTGTIVLARKNIQILIYPIIRPRGGDFLYSDLEWEIMKEDIRICKDAGCDGIVTGILTAQGQVDKEKIAALVNLAWPMGVAFHRAFDMAADPFQALEDIISCGCERILTSGRSPTALEGAPLIARLVAASRGRIVIMPGAGIREHNIAALVKITGATEFHSSASMTITSGMIYRNPGISMGASGKEYDLQSTDVNQVRRILSVAREARLSIQ